MLKKNMFFLVFVVLLSAKVFALDLTVTGGAGNFSFNTSSSSPLGADNFKGQFYPMGRITIEDQISDIFGYSATAERDPLYRNVLSCEMTINADFLKLSIGPLFSLFNSWDSFIRPGVSAGMGLEFPGFFFIDVKGGATFGSILEHDFTMETTRIALGVWLPNLLSTLSLTTGKFTENNGILTQDELLRISYRSDIHAKNVPYVFSFEMGYQYLKRSYNNTTEDLIRAVFLGFELDITVRHNLTVIIGAETPIFVWGKDPLERARGHWFFKAFTGFVWTIDKKPIL